MIKKSILIGLTSIFFGIYPAVDNAAKAKFLLTAKTSTHATIATDQTITVSYLVTNQTNITRTLTINPIEGAQQITSGTGVCTSPFTLSPGTSCTLILRFTGSSSAPSAIGGPVVCKTKSATNSNPDPFLCSQPPQLEQLFIHRIPPVSQLSISPSGLTLTAGGGAGIITVTNHSLGTIHNVSANLSGTALNNYVTQNASDCVSLAPDASCTLSFTPGNTAVSSTSFPIQGDNSLAVGATIVINNLTAPSLEATNSPLVVNIGSSSNLQVTNTSSTVAAYNVTASPLPSALTSAGVTTPSVACSGPIAPGGTCNIPIDATAATVSVPSTNVVVQATNVTSNANAVTDASVAISGTINLSLNPSSLTIFADGSSTGTMTITNNGTVAATNVAADFSGTALYGNVSATTCSSISPNGGNCVMTFTAGTTDVSATNFPINSASPVQTVIGTLTLTSPRAYFSYGWNITAEESSISLCNIDPASGNLSQCAEVLSGATYLNNPMGLALNPAQTYLYIPNRELINGATNYSITQCTVNASSGALSNCILLSDPTFNQPTDIYINAANTYAYVANWGGTNVSICPINSSDGSFAACTNAAPTFSQPSGIILNPAQDMAYIAQNAAPGVITQCVVSGGGSTFSSCQTTTVNNAENSSPFGLAIDSTGTNIYSGDFVSSYLYLCPADGSGYIAACETIANNLAYRVTGLSISSNGNDMYAALTQGDTFLCTLTSGIFSNCQSNGPLVNQFGVALLND